MNIIVHFEPVSIDTVMGNPHSDRDSSSTAASPCMSWQDVAKREFCEIPSRTPHILDKLLRKLAALQTSQFVPYLEPTFVMAFLRVNKFNEEKAIETYQRFFRLRTIDPAYYYPINRGSLCYKPVLDNDIAFILSKKNPRDGSTVVVATFEFFEPSRWHNLQEMYTPMALQVLMLLRDPEVQVRGFRMVVDLKKFSFKYIRYVPTSLAKVMGESSSGAMPVTIRGVHVINEPVWYQVLMKMIAPFLTDGESVTQTHGNDLASLHRIIDRSILPKEFGGAQGSVVFETQVMEEFYARDKEILAASRFGYKLSDTGKTWQSTSKTDDRRGSSESSNSLN